MTWGLLLEIFSAPNSKIRTLQWSYDSYVYVAFYETCSPVYLHNLLRGGLVGFRVQGLGLRVSFDLRFGV